MFGGQEEVAVTNIPIIIDTIDVQAAGQKRFLAVAIEIWSLKKSAVKKIPLFPISELP